MHYKCKPEETISLQPAETYSRYMIVLFDLGAIWRWWWVWRFLQLKEKKPNITQFSYAVVFTYSTCLFSQERKVQQTILQSCPVNGDGSCALVNGAKIDTGVHFASRWWEVSHCYRTQESFNPVKVIPQTRACRGSLTSTSSWWYNSHWYSVTLLGIDNGPYWLLWWPPLHF